MKVLLIDDNQDITEMISFYLENTGISCKVINQGREGLEAIKKEDFDIIMMDLAMPEFSGYDILKKLKNDNLLQSKNIVVLTASSLSNKDIDEILSIGVKVVLRKPLSVEKITETIEKFQKNLG